MLQARRRKQRVQTKRLRNRRKSRRPRQNPLLGIRKRNSNDARPSMTLRMDSEAQHIEVHKFYGGTVVVVCFLALVLQAFLNKFSTHFQLLELPLLVVAYFGHSRRNS